MIQEKIFLLIPDMGPGGAERVMSTLANRWAEEKRDVTLVLVTDNSKTSIYRLAPSLRVIDLGYRGKGCLQRIYGKVLSFFRFLRLVRRERPDAVLSFLTQANVMNVFTHVFVRYRCVISERDNMYHGLFFDLFIRSMFRFADGIIAQTTMSKDRLSEKTGNQAIEVIPNPIDVRRFSKSEPQNEQKIIINLGRLIPEKGQNCLISVFASLSKDFPEWRLAVYGAGPLKENLKKLAESLAVIDRVEIHDPSPEVPELLANSSIFAFPSFSEGFPNSLAEAMIAGKACVSFDCDCGPRDMIENGVNGILIPVDDTNALKKSLRSLMESPELRRSMGERARELSDWLSVENVSTHFWDFTVGTAEPFRKRI